MALTKEFLKGEIEKAFKESEKVALDGGDDPQKILVDKLADAFTNSLKKLDEKNILIIAASPTGPVKMEKISVEIG